MNQSFSSPPPEPMYWLPGKDPNRQLVRRTANVIGGGLLLVQLILIVLYYGLSSVFSLVDPQMLGEELNSLIEESLDLVSYTLGFWFATLFMVARIGIPARAAFPLRLPKASLCIPAIGIALGTSVVGSTLSTILSGLLYSLTGFTPYMPDMPLPAGLAANIVYVLNIVFVPAVFEELMFRGVILQSLRRFGDGFALVVSSVLFSLLHGNLVQGPNTLLMGLVVGYFVLRTGSIWTGILMHFFNNGFVVVFSYLAEWMTEEQIQLIDFAMVGGYFLLGLLGVSYIAVFHGGLFRLQPSDFPMPEGKKYTACFTAAAMVAFVILQVLTILLYVE